MDKTTVFTLNDVSFSYGNVPVLKHLSLEIIKSRFYGIVGPNGCGKTTMLDLMAGIREPQQGTIAYKGKNLKEYGKRELAKNIALVPQDFYINFPFTVEEIIFMGRHPYIPRFGSPSPEDVEIVKHTMELMEIEEFSDKYVTELSGGEKQRVVFARAFAQDTPVLILDEGTSNMDIRHTLKVLNITKSSVKSGHKTVIAAMHDLNLAAEFCDYLIFMKEGRIISQGHIDDVLTEDNIRKVFEVEAKVYFDSFSGARHVVFRTNERARGLSGRIGSGEEKLKGRKSLQ
ncbi:MAG TPA: ABC transporter ATP-binding protein [Deltaproteobacteria bacterium]|nr:ABC transporter ATP-binding protein [Deltaproteobacteria bacterium]